ncbi:LacI family DNA-binding transcriptional regulator [Microbacterium sp. ARD31]|uniref:LacI family DNA-binding transcriptional regulator n=1 Tax=Microbacterium sp. ARD31 TaxID=2962576 RepID=UPI002880CFC6|nr:LacI family DNA-binding transcriptional regulator [Microbacterium sp. ARD31]MDT0180595.1 LacI family DNA-binding transcriptional regulator [Microbacterium sp. ARD31]
MSGGERMTADAGARRFGVRDVARLAGVSTQTVSRVINDHPHIRPETRRRVVEAMVELDYRVNNAARALGTRTTRTLGVIASDATLYGPAVGIAALETAAQEAGRWIATAYADAADAASVIGAARRLLAQGVDGLVVLAPHVRTFEALAASKPGVRLVALHADDAASAQRDGAALAVHHLVELGHRRIARIAGPADWREAAERDVGVRDALDAAALSAELRWEGDWSAASAAALAPAVAETLAEGVTAVVVANDQMALGLISGLRGLGVDVPGQVSVTGFDDNPDAAFYRPALTTVRLDLVGEARRAVSAVLGQAPPPSSAPPELVVRASTAPPRG